MRKQIKIITWKMKETKRQKQIEGIKRKKQLEEESWEKRKKKGDKTEDE